MNKEIINRFNCYKPGPQPFLSESNVGVKTVNNFLVHSLFPCSYIICIPCSVKLQYSVRGVVS